MTWHMFFYATRTCLIFASVAQTPFRKGFGHCLWTQIHAWHCIHCLSSCVWCASLLIICKQNMNDQIILCLLYQVNTNEVVLLCTFIIFVWSRSYFTYDVFYDTQLNKSKIYKEILGIFFQYLCGTVNHCD